MKTNGFALSSKTPCVMRGATMNMKAFFALILPALLSLLAAATPVYEPVAAFTAAPQNPDRGALLRWMDGNFYGLSANGGLNGQGTLFRVTPAGVLTVLIHFTGGSGAAKGSGPRGGLYADAGGWLWGTTLGGGASNVGTVFKYNIATRTFTTVVEFTGTSGAARGRSPYAGFVADASGQLWSTTLFGGTADAGTVFRIHPFNGALTTVVEFTGNAGTAPGRAPYGGVVSDGAGFLWGTTLTVGSTGFGEVYKVNASTGAFTQVVAFTGTTGAVKGSAPHGALHYDGAGFLRGTTVTGGGISAAGDPGGYGQIFRLRFGPTPVTLPATNITHSGALLHGTVNPNGTSSTVSFDFGTDPALSTFLPIPAVCATTASNFTTAGSAPEAASAVLNSLVWDTTYYYRIRAFNANNAQPQTGAILSFTTPQRPSFSTWITGFGIIGPAAAPDADADHDGTSNALEYIAGTSPLAATTPFGLTGETQSSYFIVKFYRADSSETGDVSLSLLVSPSLSGPWDAHSIGATTAASSPEVAVTENGTAPDLITVTLPMLNRSQLFARVMVNIAP